MAAIGVILQHTTTSVNGPSDFRLNWVPWNCCCCYPPNVMGAGVRCGWEVVEVVRPNCL
jgi:hypothetical protein